MRPAYYRADWSIIGRISKKGTDPLAKNVKVGPIL